MKSVVTAVAACVILVGSSALAQSPNGQFGIGLTLGTGSGAQFTYAVNPNIHLGGRLGFTSTSMSGESQSQFAFAPFFRYLIGSSGVVPYLHGEFQYSSISVSGTSSSQTALFIGAGIAHYWNASFGVRAEANILQLGLDPSSTTFEIAAARIGIDWFFGR